MLFTIIFYLEFFYNSFTTIFIYLFFSFTVSFIGFCGLLFKKYDLISLLICIELMFFGIGIHLAIISSLLNLMIGQIYCLIILAVVTAESVIGLSIVLNSNLLLNKIEVSNLTKM